MKREDFGKLEGGCVMLYAHSDTNLVEEGISEASRLSFAWMFNGLFSHMEHMVDAISICGMKPPRPYRRNIQSLSDDELSRITPFRLVLPSFLFTGEVPLPNEMPLPPIYPGQDLEFIKILNKVTQSHMEDLYNFPLISWFGIAKVFDFFGASRCAEWMYEQNRRSTSHFWECACWGIRNIREAVKARYGIDLDIDGPITGDGMETPASVGGSPFLEPI